MSARWRNAATWSAVAGLVAPVIFVVTFTVHQSLRPDYEWQSMFVSELSLGATGWVQKTNFVVSGCLIAASAFAVRRALGRGRGSVGIPTTLVLLGLCLAASGFFDTDPSAMFDQVSWHGRVHGLLGAVVFVCIPVLQFLLQRRFRLLGRVGLHRWFLGVGLALVALTAVLKVSELAPSLSPVRGLIQRADLVLFMISVAVLAIWTLRHHAPRHAPAGRGRVRRTASRPGLPRS